MVHARQILGTPPTIDGRLDDEVWTGSEAATNFVQRDPDNGKPMTEETRVQVAYDSRYLYIAVTCIDTSPARGHRRDSVAEMRNRRPTW